MVTDVECTRHDAPDHSPLDGAATATTTISSIARLSTAELMEEAAETSRHLAALAGRIVLLAAELDRREDWRAREGASARGLAGPSAAASLPATARAWAHVGERLFDLPASGRRSLSGGAVSFDQGPRRSSTWRRPRTERALLAQAAECSVRQLRRGGQGSRPTPASATPSRRTTSASVRFNDACRTVSAQLLAETYAEVRASLESRAKQVPSDGETRWDQRLADAFVSLVRARRSTETSDEPSGSSPYVVVAHVPLRDCSPRLRAAR